MKGALALVPLSVLVLAGASQLSASPAAMPGVHKPERARVDYLLKCQGCHGPDGSGNVVNTPQLAGEVAKFLNVPGGRAFLGRVPGVASTDLDDERLAEVLNWTLYRFDAAHVPAGFEPYSAPELAALRKAPLRLDRAELRAQLIAKMTAKSSPN